MATGETIKLVAALADPAGRSVAVATLAARACAETVLLFVEDDEVEALLPAPGFPQTVPGGPEWRAFLQQARTPGLHRGPVAYPSRAREVPAIACAGSGMAVVFVGAASDPLCAEDVASTLPLLGQILHAQHAAATAKGELLVAREDARHAVALAKSLDAARVDLEQQAKSLDEARGRAEQATRAKDEFLAMLGHELRNPLAPMMTALEVLQLKGAVSREHEVLERQINQLTRLVDDLLDVSRIARGKVELRKERVAIAAVVARAIENASPLLERKRQSLSVDIASADMQVDGDPDRLAQVFSNLLTNAAKYSDASACISVSAAPGDGTAVVRVKDEGVGIEPAMLEVVFDMFAQQPQSLDRSEGGLGLGLAIVKNLVTLHGGTVVARSEGFGKGSEFVVALPLVEARGSAREQNEQGKAGLHSARSESVGRVPVGSAVLRVLVVDDNQDALAMISMALTSLGYVVREAGDGPSALLAAEEFHPQIALLDIGLPVMDGYELCRRLRGEHEKDTLRLIALTGYGQEADKTRARAAGFDGHLVKPVGLHELQRVLVGTMP